MKKYRSQLKGRSWEGINTSLKNSILQLFPEVELIKYRERYSLYRVIGKGGTPNNDLLIHEFTLKVPPGPWLLQHLLKHDAYRLFGVSPLNKYQKFMDNLEAEKKKKLDNYFDDYKSQIKKSVLRYAKNPISVNFQGLKT